MVKKNQDSVGLCMFCDFRSKLKVKQETRVHKEISPISLLCFLIGIFCSQKETCSIIIQCTAVFYTAISRLRFISKHSSVSTDQNWATVLQCLNQIGPGPPCQGLLLIETLTYLLFINKMQKDFKQVCSLFSLIRPFSDFFSF